MSLKVGIVVLAVIAAVFVAALVVGANQDDSSSNDSNSLLDRLGDAVGDPSAVPRDAVEATCVDDEDPNLLVIPGGCAVVVQQADTLRLLHLVAIDRIEVEAPAPEGDLEVTDDDVAPGDEVKVAIGTGDERTTVDVSCPFLVTECRARLVAE